MSVRSHRLIAWLTALSATALAVYVRWIPAASTWTEHGPLLPDGDVYYHLRRAEWTLQQFPAVLAIDSYMAFPDGASPIWPPALDRFVAGLALIFGGDSAESILPHVAFWVPVVMGALTVLSVFWLVRSLAGIPAAALAAFGLAVLPGHVAYSRYGFLDHHVAFGCLGAALLAVRVAWPDSFARWAKTLFTGMLLGLSVAIWPGAILFVALLFAARFVEIFVDVERARGELIHDAAIATLAAVILAPDAMSSVWFREGQWTLTTLSGLQPALLLGLASTCGALSIVLRSITSGLPADRARQRTRLMLCMLVVATLGAALATPAFRSALDQARQWLTKDEAFQSRVQESLPLLFDHQGSLTIDFARFALGAWLLLLIPALGYWLVARRFDERGRTFTIWLVASSALLILQRRFVDLGGPILLAAAAPMLAATIGLVQRRGLRTSLWVVAFALLLAPGLSDAVLQLALRGEQNVEGPAAAERRELLGLAATLAEHSPPTSGYDSKATPEYGVLVPWDTGHLVMQMARRPVVSNNFGDDIGQESFRDTIEFFRTHDPGAALHIAEDRAVRYVVSNLFYNRSLTEEKRRRFQFALHYLDGRSDSGESLPEWRLLAETRFPEGEPAAAYKLWERVQGARLRGRTLPGEPVVAEVQIETNLGRTFPVRFKTVADEEGLFAIRVPYATQKCKWPTKPQGPYRVFLPRLGLSARMDVPEIAVQVGTNLDAPDLE
ncbi:MAG: STT3 domain-containing protein [Planctomycetota bacterium]